VSFRNDLDSHTFLSLENDPLAFCILTLTSLLVDDDDDDINYPIPSPILYYIT